MITNRHHWLKCEPDFVQNSISPQSHCSLVQTFNSWFFTPFFVCTICIFSTPPMISLTLTIASSLFRSISIFITLPSYYAVFYPKNLKFMYKEISYARFLNEFSENYLSLNWFWTLPYFQQNDRCSESFLIFIKIFFLFSSFPIKCYRFPNISTSNLHHSA